MMGFQSLKIREKLMLIIVSIVFTLVLLVGVLDVLWQRDFQQSRLESEIQALAELIGNRSDAALAFNDQQLAKDNLQALSSIEHISHACLYRIDGSLLSGFIADEGGAHCEETHQRSLGFNDVEAGLFFVREIRRDGNHIGWLHIGSDISPVTRHMRQQIIFVLSAVLIATVLGVLLAGRLQKIISGPLEKITHTAHLIQDEGVEKLRVNVQGEDEVAQLAESFNTMLDALEANKEQLIAAKDEQLAALTLYRNLIESTSAIPWEMDPTNFTFTFIGHQVVDIFGYPFEEWFRPGFLEKHIHPDDREQITFMRSTLEQRGSQSMEFRLLGTKGNIVWIHNEYKIMFKQDRPVRMQGFMLDVSESREHEEALRSIASGVSAGTGEVFFEQLVQKLADLFAVVHVLVAVPVRDKPGWVHSLAFCSHGEIKDAIDHELKNTPCLTVAKGEVCIHERDVQAVFPNDEQLKAMHAESYIGMPLIDSGGSVLGMIILIDDKPFTQSEKASEILKIFASRATAELERISSDRRLREKEYEQRQVLDSMVDAVISIDETGVILTFNKAAETMFGYANIEIIGQDLKKLMPEEYSSHHDEYLQSYLTTGQAKLIGMGRNVHGKRKTGEVFPMRISVAELPKGSNGKRRFVGSCIDLTLIKNQEELLRRSQKMDALGKLTGGVAHDFNNILGIILGYSDLLDNLLKEHPKLQRYSSEIKTAGERGAKLTKKLLSFSRATSSDTTVTDINHLLLGQQHLLEKTLTARIDLVFDLEDHIWPVELDPNDFDDAVLNMAINAMHSIEDSGYIKFKTRNQQLDETQARQLNLPAGDYVVLSIIDTGSGMDELTRERIFDPFYSTKGESGTGLGLTQVYGFVQRSQGTIRVTSDKGAGSEFALFFPHVRNEDREDSVGVDTVSNEPASSGGRILVVDDEPALLSLLDEVLSGKGYQVALAENAKQAIERLQQGPFDLVISDVIMPEMNGFELASYIRKHYPDIKIQLASGFNDEKQLQTSDNELQQSMLRKPIKSETLLKRVGELLD